MTLLCTFLIITVCVVVGVVYVSDRIDAIPSDAVVLRSISALTLSKGRFTTGRRASPIPQLNCVGGSCQYQPNTVLCKNVGWDGSDVQWACEADLRNGLKFGRLSMLCEGYNHPDDEYILRGSCGLEYTLEGHVDDYSSRYSSSIVPSSDSSSGSWISLIVFIAIGYFIWRACADASRSGGGGGGGGYSGDNGPPPYGSSFGSGSGSSAYSGGGSYSGGSSSNCGTSSSSSGPGFWSGVGAGALGGYLLSRNRSSGYYSAPHYSTGSASPSFGGGFSSSSGGTTHSTGYGGTRRR